MLTEKQIAALKYLILKAKNGTDLSKRILVFLIDHSEGFTREVAVTLTADQEGYTGQEIYNTYYGFERMVSYDGTTHLDQIIDLVGTDLCFSFHYGHIDTAQTNYPFNNDGQDCGLDESLAAEPNTLKKNLALRYTFWLAKKRCPKNGVRPITTTRFELEQINLDKPGLYSHEPA